MSAGRRLILRALAGQATEQAPVALFTWGFDYTWKVAGLQPWQLACGGSATWHKAHLALVERHTPDAIFYEGAGRGPEEPTLLDEDAQGWVVRDNNTGTVYGLLKDSLALYELETGVKSCDPVGELTSVEDVDRLTPCFTGWGETYVRGLRRLIEEVGDRALVLPHHSPAYICACYAFGFEPAMTALMENPELFRYTCERYAAGDRLRMRQWAEAGAEAVFIADGWASCDVISPKWFERFALPYQASITQAAHEAGLRIILWNEGDILPILRQEAALPVDAFAFEQPRKRADITVARVRQAFGPHRCLFGNLDSEGLLLRNDPAEIARAVAGQSAQSGPDAPFVFCTGSPLPSNVEPSAVDALIRAVRDGH